MILPPLLSSGCNSVQGFKDFGNDVHFDSDSKDKDVKPFGYDSMMEEKNVSQLRDTEEEQVPDETCDALDSDEEDRNTFVSTLTQMRPGLQEYNTVDIQLEANESQ